MSQAIALFPYFIGLLVLLALSGFFSGSETALFSLSRSQVKRLSEGTRADRAVHELLQQPQRLLSAILVGNMLVNVMLASLVASLAGRLFASKGVGVAIGVSTVLLLVFGEVTPKTIAVHHAPLVARLTALPLRSFSRLITPVRIVLRLVTNAALSLLRQRHVPGWGLLTQDEITGMLAVGEATGATDERERFLVEQILALSAIDAQDTMVPRTEVLGATDSLTVGEAYKLACTCRHSRLPVYHADLDDIWGILAVTDLPRWRGTDMMSRTLVELRPSNGDDWPPCHETPLYPAYVVPETAKVEQLLTTMQELHAQLVVIADEYGGTTGILTVDDILEEVLGQLSPSADEPADTSRAEDNAYLADGRTHIRELNRELELDLPHNGTDTVGGYVMELLGRLPRAGDTVSDGRYRFAVIKMAGRRIDAVRLELIEALEEQG